MSYVHHPFNKNFKILVSSDAYCSHDRKDLKLMLIRHGFEAIKRIKLLVRDVFLLNSNESLVLIL